MGSSEKGMRSTSDLGVGFASCGVPGGTSVDPTASAGGHSVVVSSFAAGGSVSPASSSTGFSWHQWHVLREYIKGSTSSIRATDRRGA